MISSLLFLAAAQQGPDKLVGLVTDPWLQLTSTPSGMVVEFITHQNPRITIDANGLYVKKVENMALKTDDLELQKFIIGGLKPNTTFTYSLVEGNVRVSYVGHTQKDAKAASRLAIFGDSGSGSPEQKQLAGLIHQYDPDLIVHTGDVVNPYGQEPGYLQNHFSVYGDTLARTPMVAAAGEKDVSYRDYAQYPAGLCYYKFFNLPKTSYPWQRDFGNYSFSYGTAFWLILDSNTHNDWNDARAQAWVQQELARGAKATWRFVAFHHAPWHSSANEDNRMRALDKIFKQAKVNMVFSGHVDNYQRARPDASGPYYVVSAAAGSELADQDIAKDKTKWKPFTQAFAPGFSYSQFEYDQNSAVLKQVGLDGSVVDTIRLSVGGPAPKPAPAKTTKPASKSPAKSSSKKKKG